MHTRILEWTLTMQLADGSFAIFWLELLPGGITRYYDERADREMRGLSGQPAAIHLVERVGSQEHHVREYLHRTCEFSGEFELPRHLVRLIEAVEIASCHTAASRRARETISSLIRLHFMQQAGPVLRHYRFAEMQPLA